MEVIKVKSRKCRVCKKTKHLKSFGKKIEKGIYLSEHGRLDICSTCRSREYRHKSERNRLKLNALSLKTRKKYCQNKTNLKERLKIAHGQNCCQICGFNVLSALCYHHRNPSEKSFHIKIGFQRSFSFNRLLKEIKKCDLLCQNCHMRVHAELRTVVKYTKLKNKRLDIKKRLMKDIGQNKCLHCKCSDIVCLTFHHRDPDQKSFLICNKIHNSYENVLIEAQKCDILCRNCHTIYHAKQINRLS